MAGARPDGQFVFGTANVFFFLQNFVGKTKHVRPSHLLDPTAASQPLLANSHQFLLFACLEFVMSRHVFTISRMLLPRKKLRQLPKPPRRQQLLQRQPRRLLQRRQPRRQLQQRLPRRLPQRRLPRRLLLQRRLPRRLQQQRLPRRLPQRRLQKKQRLLLPRRPQRKLPLRRRLQRKQKLLLPRRLQTKLQLLRRLRRRCVLLQGRGEFRGVNFAVEHSGEISPPAKFSRVTNKFTANSDAGCAAVYQVYQDVFICYLQHAVVV